MHKNLFKWIMAISLSLLFCTCSVYLYFLFQEVKSYDKSLALLEREEIRLLSEFRKIKSKKRRIDEWISTEKKVKAAKIDADHWLVYPLKINQVLTQNNILEFLKKINSGSQLPISDQMYWLLPEEIIIRQSHLHQDQEGVTNELLNFDFTGQLIVYLNAPNNSKRQAPQ